MSNIKSFIDEHDLDAEDVIDALDIDLAQFADYPDGPKAFYDGEPTVDELAEDFTAVETVVDTRDDLEERNESLKTELKETKRDEFADAAEDLAELTDRFGDEDDLMEKFEDGEMSLEEIQEQLAVIEDALGSTTTTVGDEGKDDEDIEIETSATYAEDIPRTSGGKLNLSTVRR